MVLRKFGFRAKTLIDIRDASTNDTGDLGAGNGHHEVRILCVERVAYFLRQQLDCGGRNVRALPNGEVGGKGKSTPEVRLRGCHAFANDDGNAVRRNGKPLRDQRPEAKDGISDPHQLHKRVGRIERHEFPHRLADGRQFSYVQPPPRAVGKRIEKRKASRLIQIRLGLLSRRVGENLTGRMDGDDAAEEHRRPTR